MLQVSFMHFGWVSIAFSAFFTPTFHKIFNYTAQSTLTGPVENVYHSGIPSTILLPRGPQRKGFNKLPPLSLISSLHHGQCVPNTINSILP